MNEDRSDKKRLDEAVRTRMKGLGLDALFHQVDKSRKDETGPAPPSPAVMYPRAGTRLLVDAGSSSVKIACVRTGREGMTVEWSRCVAIPRIVASDEMKRREFITNTLADLAGEPHAERVPVRTLLPGGVTVIKTLSLPAWDRDELRGMVELEAGRVLPFPRSEIEIDFDVAAADERGSTVILAAARRDDIDGHLALLEAAGITPETVGAAGVALFNSALPSLPREGNTLQVDIGAAATNINLVRNGTLALSRSAAWGTSVLAEKLAGALGVGFDTAESVLRENGLTESRDDPTRTAVHREAVPWAEKLAAELDRTVKHFQLAQGPSRITRVMLSGGGSMLPGLDVFLENRLGVQTRMCGDPDRRLHAVLGLAPAPPGAPSLDINLLPQRMKSTLSARRRKNRLLTALGASAAALIVLIGLPFLAVGLRQGKVRRLDAALSRLEPGIAEVTALNEKIRAVQGYVSAAQSSLEIMREISLIAPPDVTIDRFDFKKDSAVILVGIAASNSSAVGFSESLSQSSLFTSAKLLHTRRKERLRRAVDFEIRCIVNKSEG